MNSAQAIKLTLEVVPENHRDADPALVDAIGRDTADRLRNSGYTVVPVYTGRRGGNFLVEIVAPVLIAVWANKDVILADSSALVTIFTPVVLIAQHLFDAYKQQMGKDAEQQSRIKITIEIDGAPISVEAPDLATADAALKLAHRYQAQHPAVAAKVTPQSMVKVAGSIPKEQPRRRR